jgi:hypothetical protein
MRASLMAVSVAALLTTSLLATEASAYDRRIKIINDTNVPIWSVFAGHRDRPTYSVIPAYSWAWVDPEDYSGYCVYDVKVVFQDGDVFTRRMNACSLDAHWRFY